MFETGRSLAEVAPWLRYLVPLLGVLASGSLVIFGLMGVILQRTFALARTGGRVEGGAAIAFGVLYLSVATLLVMVLSPVAAGLVVGAH